MLLPTTTDTLFSAVLPLNSITLNVYSVNYSTPSLLLLLVLDCRVDRITTGTSEKAQQVFPWYTCVRRRQSSTPQALPDFHRHNDLSHVLLHVS